MDDIGIGGGIFIVVAAAVTTFVFVAIPLWAAVDVFRSRDTIRHPWLLIVVLIASIPFLIGGVVGVVYFARRGRDRTTAERTR